MTFSGIDDQTVELTINGYQFPESAAPEDYDSNWLLIKLNVKSKQASWQTIDPSLLTWDVEELSQWLRNLADEKIPVDKSLEFLEPNLSFQLIKSEDGVKRIRINFDLESRPNPPNEEMNYFVDCFMTSGELRQAANELSNELSRFPKR